MLPRDLIFSRTSKLVLQKTSQRFLARSSQKPRPERTHHRLWSIPGELVREKDILAKQHIISWHPGLNAGIDMDRTIYALCDGVMIITEEKFDPDWEHPIVSEFYKNRVSPSYKRYLHVIPKKRISEFKLVDEV